MSKLDVYEALVTRSINKIKKELDNIERYVHNLKHKATKPE